MDPVNTKLILSLVLPYLEWLERGDDPKDMDVNMTEDLSHITLKYLLDQKQDE